jgi:hypothetical protein
MAKEINKDMLTDLIKVANKSSLTLEELANIVDELRYLHTDNDYDDSALLDISEMLYEMV